MKTITTLLVSITLLSCNQNSRPEVYGPVLIPFDSPPAGSDELIGEWGIYSFDNFLCNACPTVIFRSNKTATIIFPNGETQQVTWRKESNKITIPNVSPKTDANFFEDEEYSMVYSKKEKESLVLKLNSSTHRSFTLTKHGLWVQR